MTEQELFAAFDYQRFAQNARLQAVIDGVHARTSARALTDEELDLVSAAGTQALIRDPEDP